MTTYSVLIAWQDGDDEQGEFGWTGDATDGADAEKQAREAMKVSLIENYFDPKEDGDPDDEEDVKTFLEHRLDENGEVGGRVLDCHVGAIWRAADLETALRDLIEWEARMGGFDAAPWSRARALLANLYVD